MKNIYAIIAILIFTIVSAQVPQGISYQAIALNASGNPVVNSNVGVRLSILDNSIAGNVLYTETHVKTTNAQGLFNLIIGQGTIVSGTFGTIDWRVNSKFIKVEMDTTGGSNYILAGTTQLLSVPYALAADSLVTSPGEGITLVSPNGTPYQITVNDSGQLSLPTSGSTSTIPNTLYTYGSFNSYNPTTSLLMPNSGGLFYGYKYFASGTELKFISAQNSNAPIYGFDAGLGLALNGAPYSIISNGFYLIQLVDNGNSPGPVLSDYYFNASQFVPGLIIQSTNQSFVPTYNVGTNTFSYTVNGITNTNNSFLFNIEAPFGNTGSNGNLGDFLGDGSVDLNGDPIVFPNTTSTPKNFRVNLTMNFNGSGTYTITQI